jgi:hypothetical protein
MCLKSNRTFQQTRLLRSDITFGGLDDHAIISLKRSKTDYNHEGVEIVVAATGSSTCPVQALRELFAVDLQPPNSPLFRLATTPFSKASLIRILRSRLQALGYPNPDTFHGHSFRRGAAQTASDNGMLDSDIQTLGRWSSNAFWLYFTKEISQCVNGDNVPAAKMTTTAYVSASLNSIH